jgi:D-xylose transport system substrate-binding protein
MLTQQVPGAKVTVDNAGGSAATQLSQASTDLGAGDCILVVSPVDATSAAAIVTQATAMKIPVIAYDQLIQSKDTSYVVAFDQVKVGELQGQYIADHYQSYVRGTGQTALINGDTSAGSIERRQGVVGVLQPLFDSGKLRKMFDQFTPGDSPAAAGNEMQEVLTASQDNIQIAYAADDGLADAAIQALQTAHLNGKVLVTGAGATVTGLRHILTGDQAMTVELNPSLEAQATARLVGALVHGTSTAALVNGSLPITGGGPVPAVLETPVAVDKTNINQTVIADGSVTKAQLCTGLPAGTGGICP